MQDNNETKRQQLTEAMLLAALNALPDADVFMVLCQQNDDGLIEVSTRASVSKESAISIVFATLECAISAQDQALAQEHSFRKARQTSHQRATLVRARNVLKPLLASFTKH